MTRLSMGSLALVAALAASSGLASIDTTQSRHTLNFGANLHATKHYATAHADHPSIASFEQGEGAPLALVASFTQALGGSAVVDPSAAGRLVADAFVKHLHPQANYQLQSAVFSEGNQVFSAHYQQMVYNPFASTDSPVVNGLLNVNVDTATNQIVSFGDSTWRGREECTKLPPSALQDAAQQVFGAQPDYAGSMKCEKVYTGAEVPEDSFLVDPRLSLISLLRLGNPSLDALSQPVAKIIESIHAQHVLQPDGQLTVHLNDVPGAVEQVPAKLAYVQTDDSLELVWSLEYHSEANWYEAHVQAVSSIANDEPAPLLVADWIKDAHDDGDHVDNAQYRVFHWGLNDPTEGDRSNEVEPHDQQASPLGWHAVPASPDSTVPPSAPKHWQSEYGWSDLMNSGLGANFTDTRGNNVFAQDNPTGGSSYELNYRPNAEHLNFTFPLGWQCHESKGDCIGKVIPPESYLNVSITQLFYTVNMLHDLSYRYGFDEAAGNFQQRNFGKKGLGNDAVIANAQDGSGMNNANFATPPDGRNGRMRMYAWDGQIPIRDGDLEAGIVTHEFTHGISTRLTGGPANSGCLGWGEAGGAGEGWGDWLATIIRMHKKKPKDWAMGEWASGHPNGIRKYRYSVNSTTNPFHYKDCDRMWEVHSLGAVWAEFLFEVTEALIGKYGFSHELFPPLPVDADSTPAHIAAHEDFFKKSPVTGKTVPAKGNTLAIQLVFDGMKLQPCRPNFLDMRDAILAADHALTGGDNYCTILAAFTKRGVGLNAAIRGGTPWGGGFREEDFKLPHKCKHEELDF